MMSQRRWVNPAMSLDDEVSRLHSIVPFDVGNKLVEIYLVSARGGHEAQSVRDLAGVHGRRLVSNEGCRNERELDRHLYATSVAFCWCELLGSGGVTDCRRRCMKW